MSPVLDSISPVWIKHMSYTQHPSLRRQPLRVAIAAALLLPLAVPTLASAQQAGAVQARQSYNIPSGPLARALTTLSSRSGLDIAVDGQLTRGRTTAGVQGDYSAREALRQLLAGTGLVAEFDARGGVTLHAAPASAMLDAALVTDMLSVAGSTAGGSGRVAPGPQVISGQQIDRLKGASNADVFAGIAGVQANNLRNEAGAIDVGIRGVQGEGRVPVFIDGALQQTHTARGYQGASDRTYIDSDLISDIAVTKGAAGNASAFGSGAIGGLVNIQTLTVDDVVKDGEQYGARLKLRAFNNARMPHIPASYKEAEYYELNPRTHQREFRNGSGSLAVGYRDEVVDAVLAYSQREVGNYFAGKRGFNRYAKPVVPENGEVVNTAFKSESLLFKLGIEPDSDQRLELTYRDHRQNAGEVLAAYWFAERYGEWRCPGDDPADCYRRLSNDPDAPLSIAHWPLGRAHSKSFSASHAYTPGTPWLDLKTSAYFTSTELNQYNSIFGTRGEGSGAGKYKGAYTNERKGISVANQSNLEAVLLNYGASVQRETLEPRQGDAGFRDGSRAQKNLFVDASFDLQPLQLRVGANLHNARSRDYTKAYSVRYGTRVDAFSELGYALSDSTRLFAKASRSYRMPSLYETTVSNEPFSYDPERPLSPEVSFQYELGGSTHFSNVLADDDRLEFTASYFRNRINGLISSGLADATSSTPEWYDAAYTFINYDRLDLKGVELSAHYAGVPFYADLAATWYTDAKVCSASQAGRANSDPYREEPDLARCNTLGFAWGLTPSRIPPKKNLSLTLGRKFLGDALDLGVSYQYHSEKKAPSGWLAGTGASGVMTEFPSGGLLGLHASYVLNANVDFQLTVNNLTDRYYIQPGAVISVPEPGRTTTLGVNIRF